MFVFLQQIPPLIIGACAAIMLLFFVFLARMLQETWRVLRDVSEFSELLRSLLPTGPTSRSEGLQLAEIENLRGKLKSRKNLFSSNVPRLWAELEGSLQLYSGTGGPEGWFAIRPPSEILAESAVIDRGYQTSFHQSVPSLLTALGLMATFVAILIALQGVNVQVRGGAETVSGIGTLINGLAGKFLSSIVALLLAVFFTVIEKKLCELRLQNAYDALLNQATEVIPVLSSTRVLLDMQAMSARRTAMLENFYTEMVERLVALVKTEIVPILAGKFAQGITGQMEERLAPVLAEVRDRAGELERIARQMTPAGPEGAIPSNGIGVGDNESERWRREDIA
jgi:hypothetical protein